MKNKALITGATGFIGGALARSLLKNGWSVAIIIRDGSDATHIQDVINESTTHIYDGRVETLIDIMADVKPNVVFHLASLVLVKHEPADIENLIFSNITFGTQLLESMVKTGVGNIVFASTLWQFSGEDECQSVNLYAATKKAFQVVVDYYHDAFGISAVSLILADTYGVGDKRPKLINFLVEALGEATELSMSPGEQIIDISHVRDVARSFEFAALKLFRSTESLRLNLAVCGTRVTVKQLVSIVETVGKGKINAVFGGRPYRTREILCPAQLPQLEPNWEKVALDDGIRELIEASLKAHL
ncbi:NAD-dependent epimerase/dehydratase family protein [Pseudomonas rhodesiae]|uniref:NAD-dependent epimerase/dehydratase family protein n=1 Tax=Pseudomonas rhodesiae TaxID=76760 RepID=UPI001F2B9E91|nr:NAD(P)-dependent oxidoreductase [Pseudomonas rhodesiae]